MGQTDGALRDDRSIDMKIVDEQSVAQQFESELRVAKSRELFVGPFGFVDTRHAVDRCTDLRGRMGLSDGRCEFLRLSEVALIR